MKDSTLRVPSRARLLLLDDIFTWLLRALFRAIIATFIHARPSISPADGARADTGRTERN
jgi:hypothetical protein